MPLCFQSFLQQCRTLWDETGAVPGNYDFSLLVEILRREDAIINLGVTDKLKWKCPRRKVVASAKKFLGLLCNAVKGQATMCAQTPHHLPAELWSPGFLRRSGRSRNHRTSKTWWVETFSKFDYWTVLPQLAPETVVHRPRLVKVGPFEKGATTGKQMT